MAQRTTTSNVKLRSHFALTGELWVSFVNYLEKGDREISGTWVGFVIWKVACQNQRFAAKFGRWVVRLCEIAKLAISIRDCRCLVHYITCTNWQSLYATSDVLYITLHVQIGNLYTRLQTSCTLYYMYKLAISIRDFRCLVHYITCTNWQSLYATSDILYIILHVQIGNLYTRLQTSCTLHYMYKLAISIHDFSCFVHYMYTTLHVEKPAGQ